MTEDERPTIFAATYWKSNAYLIEDVARLGYLKKEDWVLDPTYGQGTWWKRWQPDKLVTHDLADGGPDFRKLPYQDGLFDVVAYDPPYVCVGGRTTSGIPEMHARYGLTDAPTSPTGVQELIEAGLRECCRVSKRHVLVKTQDYVSSGQLWPGSYLTWAYAEDELNLRLEDRFIHVTHPRPQPKRDRQVHARNNTSTLFVFRKSM